jgi:nucleoid-associated protein YgaU
MKISTIFTTLVLALSLGMTTTAFAKNCKKGKPCGNACIAKEDVCHKPTGTAEAAPAATADAAAAASVAPAAAPAAAMAAPAATTEAAPAAAASAEKTKVCKKGKPCGNSCISEKAVCHAK